MKKLQIPVKLFFLVISISIYLVFAGTLLYSQDIIYNSNGTVNLQFKTVQDWEAYKQKIIFLYYDKQTNDSLISEVYKPVISKQSLIIQNSDSTIKLFKLLIDKDKDLISNLQAEIINISEKKTAKSNLTFEGFYTGIGTGYTFDSSKTLTNNLMNNLFIAIKTEIKYKDFSFHPSLEIPFNNNQKTIIKLFVGYKLF